METTTPLIQQAEKSLEFFERGTKALTEDNSKFQPTPEMMTAAQQVAHAARTIHWFLDGAFAPAFNMDFEKQCEELKKVTSLKAAREELRTAYGRLIQELTERPMKEWAAPITDKMIMSGAPRFAIVSGIIEHTAHHRGVLSVYTRLVGKVPPMPYMDM